MRQEERMGLILEELAGGGSVGVAEIAAQLGVSTASIRRDLQLLEQQRLLSRTHGGAVANSTAYELPLRYHSRKFPPG
jgi:DeoR family transcriptional regulator of aga operon